MGMSDLRIRVLGPLEAERGGRALVLSKPRLREVLAILVAAHGRVVSTKALIDDLWEDEPPAGAVGAVRTFVGELRRVLEPDRGPGEPPAELVTVVDGYAFRVDENAVDDAVRATHTAFDLDADEVEAVVYGGTGR